MIVHDCEQGSERWKALRLGIATASSFDKIITPKTRKYSAQADKYIDRLVAEWLLGKEVIDVYESRAMERGKELEPQARAWYSMDQDVDVATPGFVTTADEWFGCSPDGTVDGLGRGVEIKCREATAHVGILRGGVTASPTQVQGSMWITGYDEWDSVAYHPDLPKVVRRWERDPEWMAAFDEHMPRFLEELQAARAQMLDEYGITPADRHTCAQRIRVLIDAGRVSESEAGEWLRIANHGNGLWVSKILDDYEEKDHE